MRTAEDFSISYANAPSCNFFPYLIASARLRGRGFLNRTIQHSDFTTAINRFPAPTEHLVKNFFAARHTSFSLTPIVTLSEANGFRSPFRPLRSPRPAHGFLLDPDCPPERSERLPLSLPPAAIAAPFPLAAAAPAPAAATSTP